MALIASNELMAQDTVLGQYIEEHNAITPMNRFIQGTLENVLLATGGMWIGKNKGQSFGDLLLMQNWSKTQYTLSDYAADRMSEYFKDKAQKEAQEAAKKAKEMDTVEGLVGLGWLGLRKAGSVLGSAFDGIFEWIDGGIQTGVEAVRNTTERLINWVQGEGFVTNTEIALFEFGKIVATRAALNEFSNLEAESILKDFYKDSREVTDAKVWALKQSGYDTTALEGEIAKRRQAIEDGKKKQLQEQVGVKQVEMVKIQEAGFTKIVNSILRVIGFGIEEKVILQRVKYHSQRDNETKDGVVNGSNMCNLTSLAMIMESKGIDIGNGNKQYEDRLYEIAKEIGLDGDNLWEKTGVVYDKIFEYLQKNNNDFIIDIVDLTTKKIDFEKKAKRLLENGTPIVVSGNFPNGHIVTIVGYDSTGWIVHDPYGNANTKYKDTNGSYVHYKYGMYDIGKKWYAYIK